MTRLPARRSGLLTRPVGAETVVYDDSAAVAHSLSPLAASVFGLCDGRLTVAEAGLRLGVSEAEVTSAVQTLVSLGVVESSGLSRRAMIGGAGLVGVGGVAASVLVPTAAVASSGGGGGGGGSQTIGNATTARSVNDTDPNAFYWRFRDLALTAPASSITFTAYAQPNPTRGASAASVTFLVIRGSTVVYASAAVSAPASGTFSSATATGLSLLAGDVLGFYSTLPVIPYDTGSGSNADAQTAAGGSPPAAGGGLSFDAPNLSRNYSLSAVAS